MTKELVETIATVEYDNLIYSTDVDLVTGGVTIASGQGVLKRGTVLAKNEAGKMVILGSKETEQSQTVIPPDCILCDDVDATSEDVGAVAYLSGHFNIDSLIVGTSYTITEADKDVLRTKNILLGQMLG